MHCPWRQTAPGGVLCPARDLPGPVVRMPGGSRNRTGKQATDLQYVCPAPPALTVRSQDTSRGSVRGLCFILVGIGEQDQQKKPAVRE